MREAQRAYQKDSATASEKRRCDDVLQVLSDLSMDIEALLQAAADADVMEEEGELPDHIRRLWSTYDTAINSPCLGPDLRLLQVKNERRQAAHASTTRTSAEDHAKRRQLSQPSDATNLEMSQVNETTLITNFATNQLNYPMGGPRSIFQVCRERQAEFHPVRNQA